MGVAVILRAVMVIWLQTSFTRGGPYLQRNLLPPDTAQHNGLEEEGYEDSCAEGEAKSGKER